jgi:undecaprenyl diphosphate synthase
MDGNRRWAKKNALPSFQGHDKGADVFVDTCDWCIQENIKYLTVYAFSTENWNRTGEEVLHIFNLLEQFFSKKIALCLERGIKIKVIGERGRFEKKTLAVIEDAEERTKNCVKLNVQIALSYGGRDEIIRAVKKITQDIVSQKITINDISENVFSSYLDTAGVPDVDLVIRTGGADNMRLSNFLLWQSAYSELHFPDVLWPEFSKEVFDNTIEYYRSINRKHGK